METNQEKWYLYKQEKINTEFKFLDSVHKISSCEYDKDTVTHYGT